MPKTKLSIACIWALVLTALAGEALAATYTFASKWPNQAYFCQPSGVAVDSAGNMYIADTNNHRIVKMNSSGTVVAAWGSKGSGQGQFKYPQGVAVAPTGEVFVCDTANNRIQVLDSSGTYLRQWGSRGSGDSQFDWPLSIAVDGTNVYVADTGQYRSGDGYGHVVKKFLYDGTFVAKWGGHGSANGLFDCPSGIAVGTNYVYVVDTWNQRVQYFNKAGTYLGQFTHSSLRWPTRCCVDSSGYVYVTNTNGDNYLKFSATGTLQGTYGGFGQKDNKLYFPHGIACDSAGMVYVADTFNNRICKWSGTTVQAIYGGRAAPRSGSSYSNGWFDRPHCVALDSSGNVYVADTYNNRIQKFNSAGVFQAAYSPSIPGDRPQLNWPQGVALASDGSIYVSDTENNRIVKLDASGNVYVTDRSNARVQKFTYTP